MLFFIVYILLCFAVAYFLGRKRQVGWGWSLFFCIFFSPIGGFIATMLSPKYYDDSPEPSSTKRIIGWILVAICVFAVVGGFAAVAAGDFSTETMRGLLFAFGLAGAGAYLIGRGKGESYYSPAVQKGEQTSPFSDSVIPTERSKLKKAIVRMVAATVLVPFAIWGGGMAYATYQAENHIGVSPDILEQSRQRCHEQRRASRMTGTLDSRCIVHGADLSEFTPWLGAGINVLTDDILSRRKEAQEEYFADMAKKAFFILLVITTLGALGIGAVFLTRKQNGKSESTISPTENNSMNENEYVVRYMLGQKYSQADDSSPPSESTTHTVMVSAEDRVEAFLKAYDKLTREGHHVGTWYLVNRFQQGEGEGNPLDFTDEEVARVRESGIKIDDAPGGGAHIEAITKHDINYGS